MKMSDINIFRKLKKEERYNLKRDIKLKIAALAVGGVMFLPTITGCSDNKKDISDIKNDKEYMQEYKENEQKEFKPGEHIISKEYYYESKSDKLCQLECPDGYKIMDIEISSLYKGTTSGILVTYQNEDTVLCESTSYDVDKNIFFYEKFGKPVEKNKTYTK